MSLAARQGAFIAEGIQARLQSYHLRAWLRKNGCSHQRLPAPPLRRIPPYASTHQSPVNHQKKRALSSFRAPYRTDRDLCHAQPIKPVFSLPGLHPPTGAPTRSAFARGKCDGCNTPPLPPNTDSRGCATGPLHPAPRHRRCPSAEPSTDERMEEYDRATRAQECEWARPDSIGMVPQSCIARSAATCRRRLAQRKMKDGVLRTRRAGTRTANLPTSHFLCRDLLRQRTRLASPAPPAPTHEASAFAAHWPSAWTAVCAGRAGGPMAR